MALPDNLKELAAKVESQGATRWLLVAVGVIILIRLRLILFAAALPVMAYWHYSSQAGNEGDGGEGEPESHDGGVQARQDNEGDLPSMGKLGGGKASPWGVEDEDDPFMNDLRPAGGKARGADGVADPYDQDFWGEGGGAKPMGGAGGAAKPAGAGAGGGGGGGARGSPINFADDDDDFGFMPSANQASKPGSLTGGGGSFLGPGGGNRKPAGDDTKGIGASPPGGAGKKSGLDLDDEDPLADFGGLGGGLGGGAKKSGGGGGGLDDFDFLGGGLGGLGGGLGGLGGGGDMDFLGGLGGGMGDDMDFMGGKGKGKGKGKKGDGKGKDPMAPREADPKQIFVANVGDLGEDEIRNFFEEVGDVDRLKVLRNPDGGSKGVCFVTFGTVDQAQKALTLHGTNLDGRSLVVRLAHGGNKGEKGEKGEKGDRGGKGFGGGFGGDRGGFGGDRDRGFGDRPPRDRDEGPVDLGGAARFGGAFGDRGDRDRGGKGGGRGKGPGGGPRRNERNEMDELLEDFLADQDTNLRAGDFDFSARRFLSELRNRDRADDTQRFQEALDMVLKYTASKDRSSVRKWPAYVFTLLQRFDTSLWEELRKRDEERKREKGGGGFGGPRDRDGGGFRGRDFDD